MKKEDSIRSFQGQEEDMGSLRRPASNIREAGGGVGHGLMDNSAPGGLFSGAQKPRHDYPGQNESPMALRSQHTGRASTYNPFTRFETGKSDISHESRAYKQLNNYFRMKNDSKQKEEYYNYRLARGDSNSRSPQKLYSLNTVPGSRIRGLD